MDGVDVWASTLAQLMAKRKPQDTWELVPEENLASGHLDSSGFQYRLRGLSRQLPFDTDAPVPQRPKPLESGVQWDAGFPRCQEVTAFGASEGPLPTRYCSHSPVEEPLYTGGTRTLSAHSFSVFMDRNASWWDGHSGRPTSPRAATGHVQP
ncbi:hypothetical protein E2I00_000526 [Balaenoptera physalus]|uniref:Uncharacterized protein n=1 Tax=Balaenoptera physalus TaxID=9770 RepID=A0A643C6H2_BALPH|nr:hypothetical protein E2I00_000526 [Balaenoptera physalus]